MLYLFQTFLKFKQHNFTDTVKAPMYTNNILLPPSFSPRDNCYCEFSVYYYHTYVYTTYLRIQKYILLVCRFINLILKLKFSNYFALHTVLQPYLYLFHKWLKFFTV